MDPINLRSEPAFARLLHHRFGRSSERPRPVDLPDAPEFSGEQNSVERHLNASILGRQFAEQAAQLFEHLRRRASRRQRGGRPQRTDDSVHWVPVVVGDLHAVLDAGKIGRKIAFIPVVADTKNGRECQHERVSDLFRKLPRSITALSGPIGPPQQPFDMTRIDERHDQWIVLIDLDELPVY